VSEPITAEAFLDAVAVDGWRVVGGSACAFFRTGSLLTAAQFVQAVAALADDLGATPDLDLRRDGVTVCLPEIVAGQVELARQVSALARELDLPPDPSVLAGRG
jgi:4a-hydroxytetrahydrobiopterin dehydratase